MLGDLLLGDARIGRGPGPDALQPLDRVGERADLLLPFDIGVRRLMLRRSDFSAAAAWMQIARFAPQASATDRLRQRDSRANSSARGAPTEQIERLRAAKARAQRKARGEEETKDDQP